MKLTLNRVNGLEFYVGTSGWFYPWNEKKTLEWYVTNSGLNAVELNASFYRFPFPAMIKSWSTKGKGLRWSIKVNRFVTHIFKFGERAFQSWEKFYNLFAPLDANIDFFLFQAPPSLTPKSASQIEKFFEKTKLDKRFALEIRNSKWFAEEFVNWASRLGITWVSIDSPDFPRDVFNTNGVVYVRMHGRTAWYAHLYSVEELKEVAERILRVKPEKAYVFFNNDHAMLENSRKMLSILKEFK
jgi:uncharacterized protein YecE (DUF72 family)